MATALTKSCLALALLLCPSARAWTEGPAPRALTLAAPETVGVSSQRLERLSAILRNTVADGQAAGIVSLVARHGRVVHFEAFGQQDLERHVPMAKDTLFRIASQTKAVTSVAAMMLVEEGKLLLGDPVSKYIPAYKQTTVRVPPAPGARAGSAGGSVPAKREITVRDLLTQTAGISYGSGPIEGQYRSAGVLDFYFADKDEPIGAPIGSSLSAK